MEKDLAVIFKYTKPNKDCLDWTRCFNTDGYPRANIDGNVNAKIHRVVYELFYGVDIDGQVVRHTCDNPKCINPEHLVVGTPTDNMRDRDLRERHGAAKLSHVDVKTIRLLHETTKLKQKDLALMYRVSPKTISSILNKRHWKHLT